MLIWLPVMLSAGLFSPETLFVRRMADEVRRAEIAALSMALHHRTAYAAAFGNGFAPGPLDATAPAPFRRTRNWKSEIVVAGGDVILLTWSEGSDEIRPPPGRMVEIVRRLATGAKWSGQTFVAPFVHGDDGKAYVGAFSVDTPVREIPPGTGVLATLVP